MWHKPQLMSAIADLLLAAAAAALLVAALVWVTRMPLFTLSEVAVAHELKEVRRAEVERALSGLLRGNFFSVNVDALRQSLERLPWVRQADVRRRWPSRLEITIEEHQPVAFWGEASGQLVNSHGEVFTATMSVPRPLPMLYGPVGISAELLDHYREAETTLQAIGRFPRTLIMSPRLALQVKLDDGMVVELGRQQPKAPIRMRLQRFVDHYTTVLTAGRGRPSVVDMRYPNGFALRVAAPQTEKTEGRGK
jgi:cell division protein FtsQ